MEEVCKKLEVSPASYQRWLAGIRRGEGGDGEAAQGVGKGERTPETDMALDSAMPKELAEGK